MRRIRVAVDDGDIDLAEAGRRLLAVVLIVLAALLLLASLPGPDPRASCDLSPATAGAAGRDHRATELDPAALS